ncbi:MAG TPA: DUF1330 domain-containing protein [Verrucomicrobiota bacterium]|jgi:uncharacterized protein (DUF1330 family)|nr:DUF1330 domain-containing protein [Nitrospinaceae bacterium]HJO08336.1 DUF1330 domain-containing protein [Verrucomicrobiota bacterium]
MKGYWINHVVEIRDAERFGAYAAASKPLLQGNNQYGAKIMLFGPVAATLLGKPVQHAAIVEFDSVQAAVDFWHDSDYSTARALMGPLENESAVVDRRVCCIEAEPLTLSARQGIWVNHVQEIINEPAFFRYAEASMPHFESVIFGQVVHQHTGEQKIQLAAALGFDNVGTATKIYDTPEYAAALAAGGMEGGEGLVVNRTICAVEVPE